MDTKHRCNALTNLRFTMKIERKKIYIIENKNIALLNLSSLSFRKQLSVVHLSSLYFLLFFRTTLTEITYLI